MGLRCCFCMWNHSVVPDCKRGVLVGWQGSRRSKAALSPPSLSLPLGEGRTLVGTTGWGHQVEGAGISHAMVIHVDLLRCGHWVEEKGDPQGPTCRGWGG